MLRYVGYALVTLGIIIMILKHVVSAQGDILRWVSLTQLSCSVIGILCVMWSYKK